MKSRFTLEQRLSYYERVLKALPHSYTFFMCILLDHFIYEDGLEKEAYRDYSFKLDDDFPELWNQRPPNHNYADITHAWEWKGENDRGKRIEALTEAIRVTIENIAKERAANICRLD